MSAKAATMESAAVQSPAPGQKVVNITIDNLKGVKDDHYKLCFAKKIKEGDYNVVWQSYSEYLKNATFSWTPVYQLFGSNEFSPSVQVSMSTDPKTIELDQQCVLDKEGDLGQAATGGDPLGLTLVNNFGSIHPGVNQQSRGIDGKVNIIPIYVSAEPVLEGTILLTPVEKVMIWFDQNAETSAMFSDAKSRQIELDLTDLETVSIKYTVDEKWVILPQ